MENKIAGHKANPSLNEIYLPGRIRPGSTNGSFTPHLLGKHMVITPESFLGLESGETAIEFRVVLGVCTVGKDSP